MASIFKRARSPFLWIKYRDETGKLIQRSTGYKWKNVLEVRAARTLCAEKTAEEFRHGRRINRGPEGWSWVPDFLSARYGESLTGRGYKIAWVTLSAFLEQSDILGPHALSRKHCFEYLTWRKSQPQDKSRFAAKHNTALSELKVLSVVMNEAVERELAGANPCLGLKIRRESPREKREITEAEAATIRQHIATVKDKDTALWEMLHYSFEISRFQGCRLMETRVDPNRDVEIKVGPDGQKRGIITFRAKGGKHFTTVLHPMLIPLFDDLKARGRPYTWKTPEGFSYGWAAARWWNFLRYTCKIRGISIHCNRVAFISELVRNNVPEGKARALVGHAGSLSHKIYQRLSHEDLRDAIGVVKS